MDKSVEHLTLPERIRCQVCGAAPTAETPLALVEADDSLGLPAYVVQCVDHAACLERNAAWHRKVGLRTMSESIQAMGQKERKEVAR